MRTESISKNVFQSFYRKQEQYKKQAGNNPQTKNAPAPKEKSNKGLIASAALVCAVAPVLAINIKRGKGKEFIDTVKNASTSLKEKAKAGFELLQIEDFKQITGASAGAIAGGLAAGMAVEKNEENKKAKLKEGSFEFLNAMIPTAIAAGLEAFSSKTGKLSSPIGQAGRIAASVAGGMFVANKASNKLNEKVFDKGKEKTKRDFKLTDCLVHVDDILNLMVITKVPLAKAIHLDKFLPLIYAKIGCEAGSASKTGEEEHSFTVEDCEE